MCVSKMYRLMRKFYDLGMNEVRIIDLLSEHKTIDATYMELTALIGLPKHECSNVRKSVLRLHDAGIVSISFRYEVPKARSNPMAVCTLTKDWMEKLLEMEA